MGLEWRNQFPFCKNMFFHLLAHFLHLGCWTCAAFPMVCTNSLLLCVSHNGRLWAGKLTESEQLYKAWNWPLGQAAARSWPQACASPTPNLSAVRQRLWKEHWIHIKRLEAQILTLQYSVSWRNVLNPDKSQFTSLQKCWDNGKAPGTGSAMLWVFVKPELNLTMAHWRSIWSISIALNQGLCSFIKFLHCNCSPWLMLEFAGICNKSPIKQ